MAETDIVLHSLSPLINSIRPFGLYFTGKARVNCETTIGKSVRHSVKCDGWNFARIYATVLLVIAWLNACRYAAVFDGTETPGAVLFTKLGIIPSVLINITWSALPEYVW